MSTTATFRNIVNIPCWRHEAAELSNGGAGTNMAFDMRNGPERHPALFLNCALSTTLSIYNPATKGWLRVTMPQAMTKGIGDASIFHGGYGPRGKLMAGSTASSLVLDNLAHGAPAGSANNTARSGTTATVTQTAHGFNTGDVVNVTATSDVTAVVLGAKTITVTGANTYTFTCLNAGATTLTLEIGREVMANQLADRGDSKGCFIRVIGLVSGKSEVRQITGNTSGCAPTVSLDTPLSFTPAVGDRFEILSGRLYMINSGAPGANTWRYYDVATGFWGYNLPTANLPTIGTDSNLLALADCKVPWNRKSGEGFLGDAAGPEGKCIQATAASGTSITASGLPTTLQADEYRNFQVRIVSDTVNTTAVGQRARISTHTSGSNAVFTVPTWTVTPGASAKFVLENDNRRILCRTAATTSVYTFDIEANAWNTMDFGAAPAANAGGVFLEQAFAIPYDPLGGTRHSYVYQIRGGSQTIDRLDIAAGATGTWKADIPYMNRSSAVVFNIGSSYAYDTSSNGGEFVYIVAGNGQQVYRLNLKCMTLHPWMIAIMNMATTAVAGTKAAIAQFSDGSTKLSFLYIMPNSLNLMNSALIQPNSPSV